MSFRDLEKLLSNIETGKGWNIEEDLEEPVVEEPKYEIYDVLRVLDSFKKLDSFKRLYKASFDYDRNGNTISIIFKIDNFRKSGDFDRLFNSEFVKDLISKLTELGLPLGLIKRIRTKTNYKLHLHGNIGIYQTGYFKV